jgi:hypothetical protein
VERSAVGKGRGVGVCGWGVGHPHAPVASTTMSFTDGMFCTAVVRVHMAESPLFTLLLRTSALFSRHHRVMYLSGGGGGEGAGNSGGQAGSHTKPRARLATEVVTQARARPAPKQPVLEVACASGHSLPPTGPRPALTRTALMTGPAATPACSAGSWRRRWPWGTRCGSQQEQMWNGSPHDQGMGTRRGGEGGRGGDLDIAPHSAQRTP